MVKNLDYEILKAVSERHPDVMERDCVSTAKLAVKKRCETDKLATKASYLHRDGLITLGDVGGTQWGYISAITPEGRVLLERLENNRWQRRICDWFFASIGRLLFLSV